MQVLPAKQQESYLKGLRNRNGEHLVYLCEPNNFETQVIVSIQL